jgi:hypothetical protein
MSVSRHSGFPLALQPCVSRLELVATQQLFRAGTPPQYIHFVEQGAVRLVRHGRQGEEVVLHDARPGEFLWSTSPVAERLARQAIGSMPQWPPTPTGRPLIFEKTISFSPFASDGPPLYKDDCLPDPPVFSNPFAWDGKSARAQAQAKPIEKPDPQALEDCLKQLPQDSIEAESARDRRLLEQWDFDRLRR